MSGGLVDYDAAKTEQIAVAVAEKLTGVSADDVEVTARAAVSGRRLQDQATADPTVILTVVVTPPADVEVAAVKRDAVTYFEDAAKASSSLASVGGVLVVSVVAAPVVQLVAERYVDHSGDNSDDANDRRLGLGLGLGLALPLVVVAGWFAHKTRLKSREGAHDKPKAAAAIAKAAEEVIAKAKAASAAGAVASEAEAV